MAANGDPASPGAPRSGAPTIYDVAALAGVAPSTVSRALTKPGRISARTEAKIRDAAAQLRFRVNPMARALHTGRTQTIALIVADITNPVVFGIVRGAERVLREHDYTLVISESQESVEAEAEAVERLLPAVDGVILATSRLPGEQIVDVAGRKPVVVINRVVEGVESVLPDLEHGVSALLDHLTGLGHRALAYVAGPTTSWISGRRGALLRDGAAARGASVVELGPVPPTIDGGVDAFAGVAGSGATAVVAFNDLVAIGLVQEAARRGAVVPDALSVAGFDDIFGSDLIVPALTTVRTDLVLSGSRAAEAVLRRIAGEEPDGDGSLLPTGLVVRGSTAPAASS